MRPLRYSINVTLDGCCDHTVITPDAEMHNHAADGIANADALILGRHTYKLMEEGWRDVARTGIAPDWMEPWMLPFAAVIDRAKKYVVSDTLQSVDWNAEIVRGDQLEATIRRLKAQPGKGLGLGGVTLPLALARLDLIDEYEFIVHPTIAGHGPTLLAGLPRPLDLRRIDSRAFASGAIATRYARRA